MILKIKYGLIVFVEAFLVGLILIISFIIPILFFIPSIIIMIINKDLYFFLMNEFLEKTYAFVSFLVYCKDSCEKYKDDFKNIKKYFNRTADIIITNSIIIDNSDNNGKKSYKNISESMLSDINEIKEYYTLSKNMAKKSFLFTICMSVLGVVVITSSVFILLITNISFLETLIPVISGSIIEFISGTSLFIYKKSMKQLNSYYNALHTNELYLLMLDIIDRKISTDKKDEAYIHIIDKILENSINQ